MSEFETIATYMLGVLTGASISFGIILALGKKALSKKEKEFSSMKEQKSIIEKKMKRVKEITSEQLDLQSATSGPQKNALDGKYKNGLIREIKRLEEEKSELLCSIIQAGFDPEITVIDESGAVTRIKLSEYMALQGIQMPPVAPKETKKTETSKTLTAPKQIGKFTVYKGGKDDSDSGTTH
jgi:hypothetical protein